MINETEIQQQVTAIEADPERTIFILVTPREPIANHDAAMIRHAVARALEGTKREGIPVIVGHPDLTFEAIEAPVGLIDQFDRAAQQKREDQSP